MSHKKSDQLKKLKFHLFDFLLQKADPAKLKVFQMFRGFLASRLSLHSAWDGFDLLIQDPIFLLQSFLFANLNLVECQDFSPDQQELVQKFVIILLQFFKSLKRKLGLFCGFLDWLLAAILNLGHRLNRRRCFRTALRAAIFNLA